MVENIGKEIPMHYYTISLPINGFSWLTVLFLFGYFAAQCDEDRSVLPAWRSNWEKIKDKAILFWCTLAGILAATIQFFFAIGDKAPASTYSWEVPLMTLVITGWLFGLGYASRHIEYKKILEKY